MNKKNTIFCASEEERKEFFDNNTNLIYIIHDVDNDWRFSVAEDWKRLPDFNNSVMGYYQNGFHEEIVEIYEYVSGNGFLKRFDRNDKKWYRSFLPEINNGDLLFIEFTNYLSNVTECKYYMGIVVKREGQRTIVFYNNEDYDDLEDILGDEDVNILVVDNKSNSFKNFGDRLSSLYNNQLKMNDFKFVSNEFNEAYCVFWKFKRE